MVWAKQNNIFWSGFMLVFGLRFLKFDFHAHDLMTSSGNLPHILWNCVQCYMQRKTENKALHRCRPSSGVQEVSDLEICKTEM